MPVLDEDISIASENVGRKDVLLINSFHELPNDERHALNSLDFLLRPNELAFQTPTIPHLSIHLM